MTLQSQTPSQLPPLGARPFTLATDLDGTFLGGSDADRGKLYDWIEANRPTVGLIFVTGRDPDFITGMVRNDGLPRPDYVVGDVGTTIAEVAEDATVHPIAALEAEIAEIWGDAGDAVRRALHGAPGLRLQPTRFRYRVSYDMDPDSFDPAAAETVRGLGHDPLLSNDEFFDVLPRGVSKGPSLRRLIAHLGIDEGRVLAAGDTMNDHSMLVCGVPAVAVGGSEAALLAALDGHDHVHKARAVGAAGILEAIAALNLHPNTPEV
ncbi:alpha,alpha-trehalose-phosphate synthase [Meridianimarinicoccus roseus]|jgi:HAD superfamily hydrolase (TIGR01484 family)|uniref:Alpha,alpha-trehalose-phosphate synthase n=1 Tax=Meridianimarinicoccus roseus TaxID=2072018 RepID=A0A2V2LKF7_9RHOB|nr:HAD family hydrolase [Meridianimarinicoccus roseus]PWR02293.1 alpha,alpha-trehalose-phosphate synthase [Meridianimarinicoccus roseus]